MKHIKLDLDLLLLLFHAQVKVRRACNQTEHTCFTHSTSGDSSSTCSGEHSTGEHIQVHLHSCYEFQLHSKFIFFLQEKSQLEEVSVHQLTGCRNPVCLESMRCSPCFSYGNHTSRLGQSRKAALLGQSLGSDNSGQALSRVQGQPVPELSAYNITTKSTGKLHATRQVFLLGSPPFITSSCSDTSC